MNFNGQRASFHLCEIIKDKVLANVIEDEFYKTILLPIIKPNDKYFQVMKYKCLCAKDKRKPPETAKTIVNPC